MMEVKYDYDYKTQRRELVERRWVSRSASIRPVLVGSSYTPFGGSGDTLKRQQVLGNCLWDADEPTEAKDPVSELIEAFNFTI
ncbi:hypothetical protein CJU89_4630 [Yarrowia sp. B02]|nr:hypothetical protein CJU89_4630 [Yarrowia sp. B02]